MMMTRNIFAALVFAHLVCGDQDVMASDALPLVYAAPGGQLAYNPDSRGNRLPDFSRAGYKGGGVSIPEAPVRKTLEPQDGGSDDTARIQAALDDLSTLQPDAQGFRGALLLRRGLYRVSGKLRIATSGVVLQGEGQTADGTILLATGKENRTLITVGGALKITEIEGSRRGIADEYVPWGVKSFALESADGMSVGDHVVVCRPSTAEWIHDIGMDNIAERGGTTQWKAGEYDFSFERAITAIDGKRLTLDAPVVNAMEKKYGGGFVYRYREEGRITQVGVERLRLVSEYQKGKENEDEEHAWTGIVFDSVADAWIRNVTTVHFSHAVTLNSKAIFITAQDCACLSPVSQITGGRRYPFLINGQYCLVQRCYSENARHAEATGSRVCGPNVFLDCLADSTHSDTGPHHRWAVGVLWDNINGGEFNAQDRGNWGSGHGWAGAQQVFWNCGTSNICVQTPPTARNYAVGCTGEIDSGRFDNRTPGHYESHGKHVAPRSLYLKQLEDRLGIQAVENITTESQRKGEIHGNLKEQLSK